DRVDRDPADLGTRLLVLQGRHVAAAALDDELDLELALVVQPGDVQIRVVHGHTGRRDDVRRGDLTGALLAQVHGDGLVLLGGHHGLREVRDDLGGTLLPRRDGGELVQDAVDTDARDSSTRDRRRQRAPKRVAERVAEARLERLDGEPGPGL